MNALHIVQRLHEHRMWATGRLLDAATALDDDALRREHAIGQGTMWRTLMHMHGAEWVWLAALQGDETPVLPGDRPDALPGNQQAGGGIATLDELTTAWHDLNTRWRAYLAQLDASTLDDVVYKVVGPRRIRQGCRRSDILLHVCTHAHYTTAQAMNMLRHLGVESLPDPMLITMARQETCPPAQ